MATVSKCDAPAIAVTRPGTLTPGTSQGFDIRAVTLESALRWARGEIHDSRLDASHAQIVFWNELDNLGSYRVALGEIKRLRDAGCRAMIVHACNPAVVHKLEREGCVMTVQEKIVWRGVERTARRYVATPLVFSRWVAKWG
jgi:hypothetical protein